MFTFGAKPNKNLIIKPPQKRVEQTIVPKKAAPLTSKTVQRSTSRPTISLPSKSSSGSANLDRLTPHKRKPQRQASPAQPQLWDSDSSDENEGVTDAAEKKVKTEIVRDPHRRLRSKKAFSEDDGGVFPMIHAADLTAAVMKENPTTNTTEKIFQVELKYPSASQRERFDIVFLKEQINPAEEIYKVADIVTDVYLTEDKVKSFRADDGILRKLEQAKNRLIRNVGNQELLDRFKGAVDAYNREIDSAMANGALAETLDKRHHIPTAMVHCIYQQVYDRVVSPQVDRLLKKITDKNNTYGELEARFVSQIVKETNLKSDQVFLDLGSGVGNVTLRVALEAGCESWGCEIMEEACNLAELQKMEFQARCRLWGIKPGAVHLRRGDFRTAVRDAVGRADVILVNNEVFGPDLNQDLINMFLDVKEGCQIVSLKSFVPPDHRITERNLNNPVNLLSVKQREYYEGYVSWKNERGDYFIATKDGSRLEKFGKRRQR